MAFSSFNGIALCNMVTINGISRNASNQIIGQTQGVGCSHEPILGDGPTVSREVICTGVLDREPSGGVKFATNTGAPGSLDTRSILTDTVGVCSGASKLPVGWYVFFGPDGPGYDGYQILEMDGDGSCMPNTVTTC